MDYLIPVMKNDPGASHLQFAFNACALASLGNRVNSIGIDFHERSFAEYVKALQATNAAIRDPKKSTSDSLLAAVLLLSMFEVSHSPFPPLTEQGLSLTPPPRTSPQPKTANTPGARTSTAPSNSPAPAAPTNSNPKSASNSSSPCASNS